MRDLELITKLLNNEAKAAIAILETGDYTPGLIEDCLIVFDSIGLNRETFWLSPIPLCALTQLVHDKYESQNGEIDAAEYDKQKDNYNQLLEYWKKHCPDMAIKPFDFKPYRRLFNEVHSWQVGDIRDIYINEQQERDVPANVISACFDAIVLGDLDRLDDIVKEFPVEESASSYEQYSVNPPRLRFSSLLSRFNLISEDSISTDTVYNSLERMLVDTFYRQIAKLANSVADDLRIKGFSETANGILQLVCDTCKMNMPFAVSMTVEGADEED